MWLLVTDEWIWNKYWEELFINGILLIYDCYSIYNFSDSWNNILFIIEYFWYALYKYSWIVFYSKKLFIYYDYLFEWEIYSFIVIFLFYCENSCVFGDSWHLFILELNSIVIYYLFGIFIYFSLFFLLLKLIFMSL